MYIIKATFKDIKTGNTNTYYVGKIMKNRVFTFQNRSISAVPDNIIGYKSLNRCRKAMYIYFSDISTKAFTNGLTISVNYIEVK